ncbi:DoxX family protein [Gimesia chilikensis]|uniref:DoxX family protein n=1 Tax=Gimesia chilikensis TaxID=2605989 RepID=UPI0011EFAA39|nr:DoxX family protein [Gimesia chilikensis]KAA0140593.1 DoxX family protein [Gimesia chilikensis]
MNHDPQLPTSTPRFALYFVRFALAASFLSAVADRFGLWGAAGTGEVAWGEFQSFLGYTSLLLWFLPEPLVVFSGWTATILEIVLAFGLITGIQLRAVALGSCLLLLTFALCMTFGTGPEGPLSFSVWTASAASLLLATHPQLRTPVDA